MPATRTGRQSSPSKDDGSPSKMRVQPMRGARLRSASPFFDSTSTSTSAVTSQQSSQSSSPAKASPSKSARPSPRKKAPAASSALQPPPRRSTRSRSRSVDPESLHVIEEVFVPSEPRDASDTPDSDGGESRSGADQTQASAIQEHSLASISEETAHPTMFPLSGGTEEGSSSNSSDSDSGSGSDSDASSNDDSEVSSSASDSEDEQGDDSGVIDLDALLKASQQAYKSRIPKPVAQTRFEDNQDVISIDGGSGSVQTGKRSSKNLPLVVKAKHQMAKLQPNADKRPGASTDKLDQQIRALDQGDLASDKKKSKHARTVQTSTGSSWFDMPEFGASASRLATLKKQSGADRGHAKVTGGDARLASAEQLRREVQALRLRNSLDPKRFYRASAKNQAMPKFAQLGKIIASPLEPKAVLSRQERGRTVVEELIRDAEAASYAKRKFAESQASHRTNYNGRRKPSSKKRRT
ncbi:predicted rRNA processing protein [Pseudozyma hubeiensis SY62]|uniref:Predicted rRNA processing protein n=1 Tax=Pseudozyma hubeiensis (strain SY62) TaxID=1305764 RepID=R9P740_PSEHS|nr:predicted rRNA processing protein [Pseudozyma hubeiensis SY62]GAC97176.1 predicted rRNA processing protein [Pseudozyma hubeiensis SY62]